MIKRCCENCKNYLGSKAGTGECDEEFECNNSVIRGYPYEFGVDITSVCCDEWGER